MSRTDGDPQQVGATGLLLGASAYVIWGAMPLYFLAMAPAGPFEIVGWRILFSLVFCAVLLTATRAWRTVTAVLSSRRTLLLLGVAGVLIYANWQVYVTATSTHRVVEAALGYFMTPIITVLLGVVVLRERLRVVQWISVAVSVVAVAVLAIEAGSLPWISLDLAVSFGLYGLLKKRAGRTMDPVAGLTIETAWLAPVAVVQLCVVGTTGGLAFGSAGVGTTLLLLSAGVGTAVPLLLFAASTRLLPLTVVGFLQYLTPILQFVVGVFVLHESMPPARLAGFAIVWLALLILIAESAVHIRRGARTGPVPAVSVTDG